MDGAKPLLIGLLNGAGIGNGFFQEMILVAGSSLGALLVWYFKRLVESMDSLRDSVVGLNRELAILVKDQQAQREKLDDHEDRLRILERVLPDRD